MSDWQDAPRMKVNDNNIKQYAGLGANGTVGTDFAPHQNLAEIEKELSNKKLHPEARKVLEAEKANITTANEGGWMDAPPNSPSAGGRAESTATAASDDGWADAPAKDHSIMDVAKGMGEVGLNMISGAPAALAGGFNYISTLGLTGGDKDAAMAVKQGSEKSINDWIMYEPRTKAGKEMQKFVAKGMEGAIDLGGKAFEALPSAVPLIGPEFGKEFESEAMTTIGRVITEGALNVTDPLAAGFAFRAGGRARAETQAAMVEARTKLEALREQVKPVEQAAPAQDMSTMAHADDFAAINPYDVGGHVSRSEQGRPSVIDDPQGDLFGGESLQDSIPQPQRGQDSIMHESMPYELTLADKSPHTTPKAELEIPYVPDRLSLVDDNAPTTVKEYGSTGVGTRDTARAKAREEAAFDQYQAVPEGQKQLEIDAAYGQLDSRKEADLNRIKADEQLQFAEQIKQIEERNVHRMAFLDRENMDWQHMKDMGDSSLMRQDHTIMMRNDLRKGDFDGAMDRIVTNHPNPAYRELATYLRGQMGDLKTKMHDEPVIRHGDRDITGYYDPSTHTVGFSGRGGASPHTVLHELTHALTSRFINERPNDIRVTGLKDLYNMLQKDNTMAKQFPGIVNPKEFIAEAFSNPKFQEFLKGTRMNNRSTWQRFVEGVKALFGMRGENAISDAFTQAMDLGKQVVDAQKSDKALAMDKFKAAGVPKKLVDLMAVKPEQTRPVEVAQNGIARDTYQKIPGLESPISDFAFYDKTPAQIVEMARTAVDIPDTVLEKMSHQLQGGALFESLKTRNPVVKYTYERVTRAFQESALQVKRNLTDPVTGLKAYMRKLTPEGKGEIHSAMMLVEGQREMSAADLARAGFSEAQIAYHNKYREVSDNFFKQINERRVALGMTPMDKRVAHIAGRFMGDFARMVYKDGKVVGRIGGNTRRELERATAHMKKEHPEWTFEKIEYNQIGSGRQAKDRFAGMMEAINFIAKADGDVKVLLDSYQGYLQTDAVNYLNATRHAKDKVKQAGGIVGSEGHKPWQNMVKNAEEGMKAQLAYFEQGYQWMGMEKAVNDIKQVTGNKEVVAQNPRAVKFANDYLDHAMGRNQGPVSDVANWTASALGNFTGQGHSNFFKLSDAVKHRMMQKFMGLGSIPFSLTQLLQPLQTQPALIRLLRTRGLEFSTMSAQVKASQTYLNSLMAEAGVSRMDAFETAAVKYADEMGIFDVKMADHTKDINQSPVMEGFDRIADFNITIPEHLTRGTAFFFYSHMLRDAGIPAKDIFGAAENMTNMTMVNYHPIERPMGFAKLGWLGDLASTLTRYKHNQLSQVAFYTREGVRMEQGAKSLMPLATFLSTSVAFGGVMGFYGFQEADAIYELMSKHVFKKPDNLTNVVLKSGMPEVISHGVFSTMGVDMTSRFSNANIIPDSITKALMPHGSAVWDMAETTGRLVMDPMSTTKQKQFVKSWAPMSVQGVLENELFTKKTQRGTNLYVNPTYGPNMGRGRVERTEEDMYGKLDWFKSTPGRALGFRNIKESKELAQNYATGQIERDRSDLADSQVMKAINEIQDGEATPVRLKELATKAAEYGMSPDAFAAALVKFGIDNELPQKEQKMLRDAGRGFTGAFNMREAQR